jgi:hypothetical protein
MRPRGLAVGQHIDSPDVKFDGDTLFISDIYLAQVRRPFAVWFEKSIVRFGMAQRDEARAGWLWTRVPAVVPMDVAWTVVELLKSQGVKV